MLLVAICLGGIFTENPALTVSACVLAACFFSLLWQPGEPPILLFAIGFQWLQVTAKTFHADVLGVDINELDTYSGDAEFATWMSMGALAVLAIGMRWGAAGRSAFSPSLFRQEVFQLPLKKIWWFYLLFLLFSLVLQQIAYILPGLTQPVLALSGFKWAIFFVFASASIVRGGSQRLLLLAVAMEVVLGLSGFFSGFKTVFFVLIIAAMAARGRFTRKILLVVGLIASVLLYFSLLWTAVKVDYRAYVSGGERAQVVTAGYFDRMSHLFELVKAVDAGDLGAAAEQGARRISYVDFFGRVLTTVPNYLPHEGGALWLGALSHISMPRLLFPEKPPLRGDSEITNTYTGLQVAGQESGTSISIGYVAETYIDFGRYWMWLPILMLGFLWGRIYRYLTSRRSTPRIFGQGLAVAVLLPVLLFETTNVKLLGGVITSFLMAILVQKLLLPKLARHLGWRAQGPTHA